VGAVTTFSGYLFVPKNFTTLLTCLGKRVLRQARIVVPGAAHHVTQRGNNRQDIFFVEGDRRTYLSYLKESADKYGRAVSAYCLMTNHVHLIVIPEREGDG